MARRRPVTAASSSPASWRYKRHGAQRLEQLAFSCVKATSWPGPFSVCIVSFHRIGHRVWVEARGAVNLPVVAAKLAVERLRVVKLPVPRVTPNPKTLNNRPRTRRARYHALRTLRL